MAPHNILDKYHILAGELAAVEGKSAKASLNYRSGILHATSERRLGIAGLANDRLARHFVEQGDLDSALPVMDEAIKLFREWGADAVVERMEGMRETAIATKAQD